MSPFDQAPPAWLREVAKPVNGERLGESLGMSLLSLSTAFERNPDAPEDASFIESRKGINQGFYETQQNARDPQWRVKGQLLANQVLAQKAQLTATAALANEHQKETSAWMQDAPTLTPWITATPEQRRTMTAPEAKSKLGLTTLQKQSVADQTYFTRQDQMDNKLEQERLKAEHGAGITARVSDWNDAVAGASPDTFSQISSLKGNGRLPSGLPTPEAIALLNVDRRSRGMTDFGSKSTEYLQRPGRFDAETMDRLKELDADERDLRKQIATANAAGEADKSAGLTAQLDEVRKMRSEVRGDKTPVGTTAPTDQFARQRETIQDKIYDAQAKGDKKAQTTAENDLAILNRKQAYKEKKPIFGGKTDVGDVIKRIDALPIGQSVLLEHKGGSDWFVIETQADKDNLKAKLGMKPAGSKSRPAAAQTIPGVTTSSHDVMSASSPTLPGNDPKAGLKSRLAEVNRKLDAFDLNKSNVQEYLALRDELKALKEKLGQ